MRRIIIILSTLVIITVAGFLIFREGGGLEKPMPDGSIIRIEKLAFGKIEHVDPVGRLQKIKGAMMELWRKHVSHAAPPSRVGWSSWSLNAVTHPNEPALYLYLSRYVPRNGYRNVNADVYLVDEDGCVFVPTQSGGWDDGLIRATGLRTGVQYSVGWYRFEAFPRRDRKFRLVVVDNPWGNVPGSGRSPPVELLVANPAPRPAAANWSVEPLPVTRTQGSVSFILSKVSFESNSPTGNFDDNAKTMDTDFKVREEGRPSADWQAVSTELYDGSGNFINEDQQSYLYHSLCPREPAWKLKARFFGSKDSHAASNAVWTLHGLRVPGAGESVPVGQSNELQGVLVSVAAFGGAGDFTYSNRIALKAARSENKAPNMASIASMNNWTGRHSIAKLTFNLHTKKPHLALEVGDLSDDQRFTACAADDRGQQYYAHKVGQYFAEKESRWPNFLSNWNEAEGDFLILDLPGDAKTVDLILCVHTCRTAEFIFKPPQPVAAALK